MLDMMPRLEELDMTGSWQLAFSVPLLRGKLTNIKVLKVSRLGCTAVQTGEMLNPVPMTGECTGVWDMRVVELSECRLTPENLNRVLPYWIHLQVIDVSKNPN